MNMALMIQRDRHNCELPQTLAAESVPQSKGLQAKRLGAGMSIFRIFSFFYCRTLRVMRGGHAVAWTRWFDRFFIIFLL